MRKILSLIISLLLIFVLTSCEQEKKLYILNVGDYIDDSLVEEFEELYNCKVYYTEVNSNEEEYQKLKNESYDIVCVSDYMIDRMYQEGVIKEIDFSRITNYSFDSLFEDAQNLIMEQCSSYKNYFIPYFWGTVGVLYRISDDLEGLEDYVMEKGLECLFENNEYNKGMYNSSRDALCMALMVLGIDINSPNEEDLVKAKDLIKNVTYRAWGDDNLKAMVHLETLDLALVYSGDYFDESYQCEVDEEEVNFGYFAPENTNIWIDGLCITSQCENEDLAYEFLNFLSDIDKQVQNADYIGYSPLVEEAFYDICDLWEYEDEDVDFFYPYGENRKVYHYVSDEHYNNLNNYLEEAKSK